MRHKTQQRSKRNLIVLFEIFCGDSLGTAWILATKEHKEHKYRAGGGRLTMVLSAAPGESVRTIGRSYRKATALLMQAQRGQSGVALRLPPHSKITPCALECAAKQRAAALWDGRTRRGERGEAAGPNSPRRHEDHEV